MKLGVPSAWRQDRPAELTGTLQPQGKLFGSQGPDQGYALRLAERDLGPRLRLAAGESGTDVVEGCTLIALARASRFGRAPVLRDLELAAGLFGYLHEPASVPDALLALRAALFSGAGHAYALQRRLVSAVPEATLRMASTEVKGLGDRSVGGEWELLLGIEKAAV